MLIIWKKIFIFWDFFISFRKSNYILALVQKMSLHPFGIKPYVRTIDYVVSQCIFSGWWWVNKVKDSNDCSINTYNRSLVYFTKARLMGCPTHFVTKVMMPQTRHYIFVLSPLLQWQLRHHNKARSRYHIVVISFLSCYNFSSKN